MIRNRGGVKVWNGFVQDKMADSENTEMKVKSKVLTVVNTSMFVS